MITNWIQAVCSILTIPITAVGVFRTLPKISKDINKNANESWKRLIDLYANNPKMHEYSNLNENADKKSH
jgi:hypothetical protein